MSEAGAIVEQAIDRTIRWPRCPVRFPSVVEGIVGIVVAGSRLTSFVDSGSGPVCVKMVVQCECGRCDAVRCGAVQCGAVRCSRVR